MPEKDHPSTLSAWLLPDSVYVIKFPTYSEEEMRAKEEIPNDVEMNFAVNFSAAVENGYASFPVVYNFGKDEENTE